MLPNYGDDGDDGDYGEDHSLATMLPNYGDIIEYNCQVRQNK